MPVSTLRMVTMPFTVVAPLGSAMVPVGLLPRPGRRRRSPAARRSGQRQQRACGCRRLSSSVQNPLRTDERALDARQPTEPNGMRRMGTERNGKPAGERRLKVSAAAGCCTWIHNIASRRTRVADTIRVGPDRASVDASGMVRKSDALWQAIRHSRCSQMWPRYCLTRAHMRGGRDQ